MEGGGGGGNFTPWPPQNEPLESPPRLGVMSYACSLYELCEYFHELLRELKDREGKIKREIENSFKPIILFIEDMDKFEQKEIKKIRSIKNTWYHWLINYIPEPIRKSIGGFKDKVISVFNTSSSKQTQNNIRNPFI